MAKDASLESITLDAAKKCVVLIFSIFQSPEIAPKKNDNKWRNAKDKYKKNNKNQNPTANRPLSLSLCSVDRSDVIRLERVHICAVTIYSFATRIA